ncbi:MAG: hypothetical protein R3F13_01365 [Prosthecobacter sp.]
MSTGRAVLFVRTNVRRIHETTSLLTGIWFDAESSTGSGTFQLDGVQPR